ANLACGDLVEPARDVPAVEVGQSAVDDHEHLLQHVVLIRGRSAHRAYPARHVRHPGVVHRPEIPHVEWRSAPQSGLTSSSEPELLDWIVVRSHRGGPHARNRRELRLYNAAWSSWSRASRAIFLSAGGINFSHACPNTRGAFLSASRRRWCPESRPASQRSSNFSRSSPSITRNPMRSALPVLSCRGPLLTTLF